jgi:hypothetical protein
MKDYITPQARGVWRGRRLARPGGFRCADDWAHGLPVGLAAGQLGQPLPPEDKAAVQLSAPGAYPSLYNRHIRARLHAETPKEDFILPRRLRSLLRRIEFSKVWR